MLLWKLKMVYRKVLCSDQKTSGQREQHSVWFLATVQRYDSTDPVFPVNLDLYLPEKNWTISATVQVKGRPLSRTTPSEDGVWAAFFSMTSASLFVTSNTAKTEKAWREYLFIFTWLKLSLIYFVNNVTFNSPRIPWQSDSESAWTIPGPWNWSTLMESRHHSFDHLNLWFCCYGMSKCLYYLYYQPSTKTSL